MILFIDNYDSFVHNLARYFRQLTDETIQVVRNDKIDLTKIADRYSAIVISPGPCGPQEAGSCIEIVKKFYDQIPILGVCLGHQVLIEALGGTIFESEVPVHGKSSEVYHDQSDLFDEIPSPFAAGRYHSLIGDSHSLPNRLRTIAKTESEIVMAVRHREYNCFGIQFHPESVLTEHGYQLIRNFLRIANIDTKATKGQIFA